MIHSVSCKEYSIHIFNTCSQPLTFKFYETSFRKFNCPKKFYNLAAVRVETIMKEYKDSGVKYYPQSVKYMDNRYFNHYNSINEEVKNKVQEIEGFSEGA